MPRRRTRITAVAVATTSLLLAVAGQAQAQEPYRCIEKDGPTLNPYPLAKFMEIAAGDDVTASLVYGQDKANSVGFTVGLGAKGVGISLGNDYGTFSSRFSGKNVLSKQAFNMFLKVSMYKRTFRKVQGNHDVGLCSGTPDGKPPTAKTGYVVRGTPPSLPVVAKPMVGVQKARTDCNLSSRWQGQRVMIGPDSKIGYSNGQTSSFSGGLMIPGLSFDTTSTFGSNTNISYTTGHRYAMYWACGDGATRGANNEVDLDTAKNLFVSPVNGTRVKK